MNSTLIFYQQNTDTLIDQYDSVSFEAVHHDWLEHIPLAGCVLDVGAGSGRDARYLADRGLEVYAAEPVYSLVTAAENNSQEHEIVWFQDRLPSLTKTRTFNQCFDLILLSAVWMHLSPEERILSMQTMSKLLLNSGKLVITLRYGEFADGRLSYRVCAKEVSQLAREFDLTVLRATEVHEDQLGRNNVTWQTLVLQKLGNPTLVR